MSERNDSPKFRYKPQSDAANPFLAVAYRQFNVNILCAARFRGISMASLDDVVGP